MKFTSMLFSAIAALCGGTSIPTPKQTYRRPTRLDATSDTFVSINAPHRLDGVDVDVIIKDLQNRHSEYFDPFKKDDWSRKVSDACYAAARTNQPQTILVIPTPIKALYIKRRKGTAAKQGGTVVGTTGKYEWILKGE